MNQIEINSSQETVLPNFLPQGILLPSDNGLEFTAFTFVPNCLYQATDATLGTPESITNKTENLEHICLNIVSTGKIDSVSDFQGRPLTWTAKNLKINESTTHIALHVVLDNKTVLSSSIVTIDKTPANKLVEPKTQKLTALENAIDLIGKGGFEPIQLLKKMKDTGF